VAWLGEKLKAGLAKTRKGFLSRLEDILPRGRRVDGELLEDLEDVLLGADVGLSIAEEILERVKEETKGSITSEDVKGILRSELLSILAVPRQSSSTVPGGIPTDPSDEVGPGAPKPGAASVTQEGALDTREVVSSTIPEADSVSVPEEGSPGVPSEGLPHEERPTTKDQARPGATEKPQVILVVGVNGAGKTTTVGKLAWRWSAQGKSVLVAASDTFRAGATEQLDLWVKRTGGDIVRQERGADPAAVAFDALQAAKARGCDYLLVDTAGRLHTKANLMEELKKIRRVLAKLVPGSPHRVLLVLDATAGQNALVQAREFGEATGVTGIVMAKLDGTARGGAVIAVARELSVPVEMLGVGEGPEDLTDFDPEEFVDAMLAP
jgi:fused signal recognition particle receptor